MTNGRVGRQFKRRFSRGGSNNRGIIDRNSRRYELGLADTTWGLVDRVGGGDSQNREAVGKK